jgi:glycosyltransferase involved in cell wall biosynthesis
MHFDHLETRFSFRTRILDYLWAGLPIITTRGDSFAELVEEKNLGRAVPYENPEAIAVAIVEMYDNPKKYQHFASNSKSVASDFHWEKCVEPINTMIETLINQPVKSSGATASVYLGLIQLYRTQKIVAKKLTKKVLRIES